MSSSVYGIPHLVDGNGEPEGYGVLKLRVVVHGFVKARLNSLVYRVDAAGLPAWLQERDLVNERPQVSSRREARPGGHAGG